MSEFTEKVAEMMTKASDGQHEPTVTIAKSHYAQLLDDQYKLECLEAAGVDNWSGYDDAMEMYREGEEEDE